MRSGHLIKVRGCSQECMSGTTIFVNCLCHPGYTNSAPVNTGERTQRKQGRYPQAINHSHDTPAFGFSAFKGGNTLGRLTSILCVHGNSPRYLSKIHL